MGEPDSPHAGIDLDAISVKDLIAEKGNHPEGEVRSDPQDYRVFVNSIIKKMKGQDAFISFSHHISNVNQILTMKYSSAADIARVILKDMALTAQVLTLVNSSFYRQFSSKGISTISEAMIILGTDEVRQVAASLKVYEMMKDLANSDILKEKTLKGLQRSIMARQINTERGSQASDTLQISSMVYELGEYLVALFDPETYIQVEISMEEKNISKIEAAKSIMGLSYADLGRIVALKLNLPEDIVQAMRPVTQFKRKNGASFSEKDEQRYLCAFIKELCDIPDGGDDDLDQAAYITDKYRDILKFDMRKAVSLIKMSREKTEHHAALLDIDPLAGKRVKSATGVKDKKVLDEGMSQLKDALKKELSIHEIFTRLVETMDNSFYFNQTVISIPKKQTNTMEPRFIRGPASPREISSALSFKIESGPDLFNNAIDRKTDIIVRDIQKEAYKRQIPQWYMTQVTRLTKARGFAVFPVFVDDKILAMIYVDWDTNAPDLNRKTIEYLRVFRELMIKTFTLHSR